MSTYKITNITNTTGKRDHKFNSDLDIEYIDNMTKKVVTIKPGKSLYLTAQILPMSVHRLRMKNLIIVEEISATEMAKLTKPVSAPQVKKETSKFSKTFSKHEEEPEDASKKSFKKKFAKKEEKEDTE